MAHYELDAKRLLCPMPVIRAQNRVKTLIHGDTLAIIATDPGAMHDLPSWSRIHGHNVIQCEMKDNEVHILLQINKDI